MYSHIKIIKCYPTFVWKGNVYICIEHKSGRAYTEKLTWMIKLCVFSPSLPPSFPPSLLPSFLPSLLLSLSLVSMVFLVLVLVWVFYGPLVSIVFSFYGLFSFSAPPLSLPPSTPHLSLSLPPPLSLLSSLLPPPLGQQEAMNSLRSSCRSCGGLHHPH